MKGSILLKKISIRKFTPLTDAGDYVKNKKPKKSYSQGN